MSEAGVWLVIVVAGLGTLLLRLSFILAVGNRGMPDGLRRALRYVPAAVLSALVVPGILLGGTEAFELPRLAAGAAAALVAWRVRSTLWVLATGMAVLWVLSAVLR